MASQTFTTVNPYTEEKLNEFKAFSKAQVESTLELAEKTFHQWRRLPLQERKNKILSLASTLEKNLEKLARTATLEMGKPYKQSVSEVEKCVSLMRYYASKGQEFLKDYRVEDPDLKARVAYEPLGVILGIMPWNFPYWQAFRFAVPTILAGNTVVLKHASATLGSAALIEDMFVEAGFLEGIYTNLVADHDVVEELLADKRIKGVSLTGSTRAGKKIAEVAGKNLKKCVLELGGSDPYIILEDADIELAIEKCSSSRMINNGQSCVAAKRFIIHNSLFEKFLTGMKHNFSELKMGDPLNEETSLGPLARKDLKEGLLKQIETAVSEGAKLELDLQSKAPKKGEFVAPQILTGVRPGTKSFNEEFFGPVAMLFSFDKEEEAFEIANATEYGLGGAIFSRDTNHAQSLARRELNSGFVAVNDMVRSEPRLAFGGVKSSGFGRELGPFGLHEFVNIKTLNF